jgi:membrane fusion protein, multidrug efflux system
MDATRDSQAEPDTNRLAGARSQRGGRRALALSALALALALAGGYFAWTRRASSPGAPSPASSASSEVRAVPVVVASVERRDVPVFLDGLGNAVPLATVTVKSQVDGRLDKVLFREGQSVKKGDVLAQVDPRPFAIALHQAQAAVARDSAQAKNAQRNLERYQSLAVDHLVPQQQVDDQAALVAQLTGSVASDQAQADGARLQLDYARITSPIDGVTGVRLVDPGNLVHAADATGIVVVTQLDPMAVVFTLPEDDLPRVAKAVASGPLSVEAFSRDSSVRLGTGKLELIDNQVNASTATIRLKAILPNPERLLWPNAFVKVRLALFTRRGALVIPTSAVQRGPQGTFVYTIDAEKKAAVRPVTLETSEGLWAVVASGLSEGESVVVEGQTQLRAGAKVMLQSAPKGAKAAREASPGAAAPSAAREAPPAASAGAPR